jgi:hypothetical protein
MPQHELLLRFLEVDIRVMEELTGIIFRKSRKIKRLPGGQSSLLGMTVEEHERQVTTRIIGEHELDSLWGCEGEGFVGHTAFATLVLLKILLRCEYSNRGIRYVIGTGSYFMYLSKDISCSPFYPTNADYFDRVS